MWARVVEVMLGCWLAISPFVFGHSGNATSLWMADWIAASLIVFFALLSCWGPTRRMHLATFFVALTMVVVGWMQDRPVPPGWQNHIFVGFYLLMNTLIPSRAAEPPQGWQEFYEQRASAGR
jgi:lysylphosphatidylglycerol synthetase-like protein (DUF2156 family)